MNRRGFLKFLGMGVVAMTLSDLVLPAESLWASNRCRVDADGWTSHYATDPSAKRCQCGMVTTAAPVGSFWFIPATGFLHASQYLRIQA